MRRKTVKQLQLLQTIKPRTEWVDGTRELLRAQINAQGVSMVRPSRLAGFEVYTRVALGEVYRFSLAPIVNHSMTAAMTVLTIFVGSGIAHFASQDSVPGDTLYAVKKTSEQIQTALVSNADQAALQVELTGKRVAELETLSKRDPQEPGKTQAIAGLVGEVEHNLTQINQQLSNKQDAEVAHTVQVASLVGGKTTHFQEVLEQTQKQLAATPTPESAPVNDQVAHAIESVDSTANAALEVIVDKDAQSETDKASLALTLEAQVKQAQQKADSLQVKFTEAALTDIGLSEGAKRARDKSLEAKKVLKEAEISLAQKDFKLAFEKLSYSKELLKGAQKDSLEVTPATGATTPPSSTPEAPEVKKKVIQ